MFADTAWFLVEAAGYWFVREEQLAAGAGWGVKSAWDGEEVVAWVNSMAPLTPASAREFRRRGYSSSQIWRDPAGMEYSLTTSSSFSTEDPAVF